MAKQQVYDGTLKKFVEIQNYKIKFSPKILNSQQVLSRSSLKS